MTSYDIVPYESQLAERANPESLSLIGALFGLNTALATQCSMLELGCGTGTNAITLASQFKNSRFLGIDLSENQISQGRKIVSDQGLTNVLLENKDILELQDNLGTFDFIIAHGLYSWVTKTVQDKVLAITKASLAPHGIAFVSYNTFPGWHTRKCLRDMMLFESNNYQHPTEKLSAARQVIRFLKDNPALERTHGQLFKTELNTLAKFPDWYLLHDSLSETNNPCYVTEFINHAAKHSLQYLCDAQLSKMFFFDLPPSVVNALKPILNELGRREQLLDFARNTMFRRTLLVHAETKVDRSLDLNRLKELYFLAQPNMKASHPSEQINAEGIDITFQCADGAAIKTNDALAKAALFVLLENSGKALSFSRLLKESAERVGAAYSTLVGTEHEKKLLDMLRKAFIADVIKLSRIK